MRRTTVSAGPPLLWLLLAVTVTGAPNATRFVRPVSLPGGVANDRTGFVTNATGGIDALDLETGKTLWTTKEASRPLVAFKEGLAAQANGPQDRPNSIRVVVLDLRDGKRRRESE